MGKKMIVLFLFALIVFGCSDDITDPILSTNTEERELKSSFDKYFDWDRLSEFPARTENGTVKLSLPWRTGSSDAIGISKDWIDEHAYEGIYSKRYYSRENGWELVYSNLSEPSSTKYFALYHKFTGILRFFFYETSSSATGNEKCFLGIQVDKSTSLFNFTPTLATSAIEKKTLPSLISSPTAAFKDLTYNGGGYKARNWYGLEIECAYDPTITTNTKHQFNINVWGVEKIEFIGEAISKGTIQGEIKTTNPNSSGFNLSLSNMFNSSNSQSSTINNNIDHTTSNIVVNSESLTSTLGKTIDEEIKKNDPFFKGLWNNVKNNASKWITSGLQSGAEKGLAAILSNGGSVVGDALGGMLSSLIGGGSSVSVSKVNLDLNMNTQIKLSGEKTIPGWEIRSLPVPGSTSVTSNMPIYNKPLGVWNIDKTPIVNYNIDFFRGTHIDDSESSVVSYSLDRTFNVLLNPVLSTDYTISNVKKQLILQCDLSAMMTKGNETLTNSGYPAYSYDLGGGSLSLDYYDRRIAQRGNPLVKVEFDLVDKKTNKLKQHFVKTFIPTINEGYVKNHFPPINPGGGLPGRD